jgi:hypothetical protein
LTKVTPVNPREKTMEEKKNKREEALQLVTRLINAEDEISFDLAFEELELCATENSDEWETPVFFDHRESWIGEQIHFARFMAINRPKVVDIG